jgi:DNA polymerase
MPVPLKYYAAHTGRWGGSDKINLQNLPSRGVNGNTLKLSIKAPEGHTIIDADSAQIEARVLAWLAGHTTLVQSFTDREDVYKKMASAIYGKPESDITKDERFVGKVTILGAGYGMGGVKFQAALKNFGAEVELEEAKRIISVYRSANDPIVQLWREAQNVLIYLCNKENATLGKAGVLTVVPEETAIKLPSGLLMRYTDLKHEQGENGLAFSYKARYGRNFIYGGKIIENVCQGIARCVIGEQMLRVSKKYKVVLTVHDAIACVVPDAQVPEARAYIEDCMRWIPTWAEGLPVNCESGFGKSYGEC